MEDFSLYILDIVTNSVRAGATDIEISLTEKDDILTFIVKDNGCGMTEEQLQKLSNPFFTTRKTRNVGLGIPFLKMLAEMTGGNVCITSKHVSSGSDHGTNLTATFGKNHIDFVPMGDITQTIVTLVQGSPEINFVFNHNISDETVSLNCSELKQILGDISLAEPEILSWISENLNGQYREIGYIKK